MQIAITDKPQVTTTGNGQQRIAAAPLAETTISPTARKITNTLYNKRVCTVLDDATFSASFAGKHTAIDYDRKSQFIIESEGKIHDILLESQMTITNWSTFMRMLPQLKKDVVVLDNPINIASDSDFKYALEEFRKANPQALVISGKPKGDSAVASELEIELLQKGGLIDYVCKETANSSELMHEAALLVELKSEATQKVLVAGDAAARCNPADEQETVLIEPIQT